MEPIAVLSHSGSVCDNPSNVKPMEELLLALLAAVGEALFEALIETFAEVIVAWFSRAIVKAFSRLLDVNPIVASVAIPLLGACLGALSTLVFPHHLFHPTRFHGISLLISPLVAGWVMSQVGIKRHRQGFQTTRIESFGYGFSFALAFALVRFALAR